MDFTAPGVGIVSTFPGGGYATMTGTSMACPVVTGMAARLFSEHPDVLALPATKARSEAMAKLLFSRANPLGFGADYEGYGLCVKVQNMEQFILAYMGAGPKPEGDLARIRSQTEISLLNDTTSDSSVLVEGDRVVIQTLLDGLPNWRAFENRQHKLVTSVRFGAKRKHAASK